jgi:hypothetical protein
MSCSACITTGTTEVNLCTTCATGYYPLADKTSQCYKSTETVTGYFFDATKFTPCDISCSSCAGSASACIACNNTAGYYSMSGKCTKIADIPQYYYFDLITKQIKKCYDSCNTCNGDGTIDMHYCVTCKTNYFILNDKPMNCYTTTTIIDGYYFQGTVFLPCYKICKTCSGSGSELNPNCTSCYPGFSYTPCTQIVYNDQCINGCFLSKVTCDSTGPNNCVNCNYNDRYYPLTDDKSTCYRDIAQVPFYYFDDVKKNFQKCYSSCKTCTGYKDIYEQLCIQCKDNFYPLIDKPSNCFPSGQSVDGYYFDNTNNIFNKCYTTCLTCKGPGTFTNPNCLTCKVGQSCDPCNNIIYNNQCITTCPTNTVYDEVNNTCYQCKDRQLYYLNGSCLEMCSPGYYSSDFTCLTCQSNNKLVFEGNCTDICPDGYTANSEGTCISRINQNPTCTDSSCMQDLCTNNTCENGGVCSIQFNKATCTCTSTFTGQYCQIPNNNNEILRGIISKKIFNIADKINNLSSPLSQQDYQSLNDILSIVKTNPNVISKDLANKLFQTISILKDLI